jgi:hypothetical protein
MGKKRRQQSSAPAPQVTNRASAVALQRAQRNGFQEKAMRLAKDGAPKEHIKDVIWQIAMTPDKRELMKSKPSSYATLDASIDDLAEDLLVKYGPKAPDDEPEDTNPAE